MVIVQNYTTKNPITMIGEEAGICYNSDTSDAKTNYKRGLECIKSEHGRTIEYPQVYLVVDEYSARVIRELYTHIGGLPTRLQSSTRYIEYGNFDYIVPKSVTGDAKKIYEDTMQYISTSYKQLEELGVPKEDVANILPLGMQTKVVIRTGLRHLMEIMCVRQCSRAYWEIIDMMAEIKKALRNYSDEWKTIVDEYMPVKCRLYGYCPESKSCGLFQPRKNN